MSVSAAWVAVLLSACCTSACGVTIDGGSNHPHGLLPVDERNPILLANDGPTDNWQGEYALLLAKANHRPLAGIIVGASSAWPDLESNVAGWRQLVVVARASHLGEVPDPMASVGPALVRPNDGDIDKTAQNRSEGARLIVSTSLNVGTKQRPLVVVTGSRLTDVADAYLIDNSVTERIVVVSSLGTAVAPSGAMAKPNGEMDPWADAIVATRFRYVQVSSYYDQLTDVTTSFLPMLPANDFGAWIAAKQPELLDLAEASDQVAAIAVGLPAFARQVTRVRADLGTLTATAGPNLVDDAAGPVWLVTQVDGAFATARLRQLILDPATFTP